MTVAVTKPPGRLSGRVVFPLLAVVPFAFFIAASAPSPMFIVMQRAWGFSPSMLTVAFAVYALALLAALLTAGSLSDHIGRRPLLIAALLMETAAMILFLTARGIAGIVIARIVQGLATGIASGAMSAAVVEAAPPDRKRFGAIIVSVAPFTGLAVGALLTGAAIRLTQHAAAWVFGTLGTVFAIGIVIVWYVPETVTQRAGALASLIPRVSVRPRARREFARGIPLLVAVWALGSLYLALIPSLLVREYGIDDGFVNGLAIATLNGVGAVAPALLQRLAPARTAAVGLATIVVGCALLVGSLSAHSIAIFFVATAIAGLGYVAAFSAIVQILAPLADAHERGELFAAIFVVSYLALSLPALISGWLVQPLGLRHTVAGYATLLALVAAGGATLQWRAAGKISR